MIEKNFQKYLFWKKKNIFNYFRQYFFSFSNKIEVSQSCTYRFWPFAPQRRGPCWVLHKKFSFVETQSFISWPQPCLQLSYQVISSYSFYFCHLGYCFIISWPIKHSQIKKGVFPLMGFCNVAHFGILLTLSNTKRIQEISPTLIALDR